MCGEFLKKNQESFDEIEKIYEYIDKNLKLETYCNLQKIFKKLPKHLKNLRNKNEKK